MLFFVNSGTGNDLIIGDFGINMWITAMPAVTVWGKHFLASTCIPCDTPCSIAVCSIQSSQRQTNTNDSRCLTLLTVPHATAFIFPQPQLLKKGLYPSFTFPSSAAFNESSYQHENYHLPDSATITHAHSNFPEALTHPIAHLTQPQIMINNLNLEVNDFQSFLTAAAFQAGDRLLIGTTAPPQYTVSIPYSRVTTTQQIKPRVFNRVLEHWGKTFFNS